MKTRNISHIIVAVLVLALANLACNLGSKPQSQPTELPAIQPTSTSTEEAILPTEVPPTQVPAEIIRQWATGAYASSQFGEANWSPIQAAGAPDTPECGDQPSAWASASASGPEWLEVYFEIAVIPSEINIIETYGSNQVTKVEILGMDGNYHEVYNGTPAEMNCPYTMNVVIPNADYEAMGVRISVDESFLHYWNEIDAVELVGISTGKVAATPAAGLAAPTPFPPPAGFLWRLGGEANPSGTTFWVPQGVFVTTEGLVYVTDYKGVIVFDLDGNQRNLIHSDEMDTISDVAVGPDGNIYVADWGAHKILVYTPGGDFLYSWGTAGKDAGAFGTFSPQFITFGPEGNLYALDDNENATGESIDRVQVFSKDGQHLRDFLINEDFFSPDDLAFGPDGNLHILSGFGRYILVLNPDGTKVGRIGDEALNDVSARTFAFDAQGNIYVAGSVVVKLDRFGKLLGTFGVPIMDGQRAWPEGGFFGAMGLGVSPDGTQVFVTDHAGDFAYLTALTFDK